MKSSGIFAPFFALIALTIIVWIYMYARRIPFIIRSRLTPQQLSPMEFATPVAPDGRESFGQSQEPIRATHGVLCVWYFVFT